MTLNFKFLLYWMSDASWYYDDETGTHLTEIAPPKAVESFKLYCEKMNECSEVSGRINGL